MFYNPKYVLHAVNRFYLPTCPLFVLATQRDASTKLTQNNLQTASRIHFCAFFLIFQSHLSYLSLKIQSLIFIFTLDIFKNGICNSIINPGINLSQWSLPWEQGPNFPPFCLGKWGHFSWLKSMAEQADQLCRGQCTGCVAYRH